MSQPNACHKALISVTILAFGSLFSFSANAASSNQLLPRSDLLALLAPVSAPLLMKPAINDAPAAIRLANPASRNATKAKSEPVSGLVALAMGLRDIRYRHGGKSPDSGFDCSGFVRYVFLHSLGLDLPASSASQFVTGMKVARDDMRSGDLVFFRTAGKKRISHVGIYLEGGRFIHAPSAGKTVRVDSLQETYWSKRFAGAKRPEGVALG